MTGSSPRVTQITWHRQLDRDQWRIFYGAFCGRVLDGYETFALMLIVVPALQQLLDPGQASDVSRYAGIVLGMTLLGRTVGGMVTGIAADYFGRRLTLMTTVVLYAVFTGLTGLSQSWIHLAFFRFLTGASMGGELATAASLLAESWPTAARAKGQSLMQTAFALGSLLAAVIWFAAESAGGVQAWRWLFFVGVLPAFWVFSIRRRFQESSGWMQRHAERKQLRRRRRAGGLLSSDESVTANFSLFSLFSNPDLRKKTLLCTLLSMASTTGFWAVSSWMPPHIEAISRMENAANPARWASIAGVLYTVGAVLGYLMAAVLADVIGRRALLAFFFGGSLLSIPLLFLWARSLPAICLAALLTGAFTLGQFAWIAIYPPELFPTAVRATALSTVFNLGRFISALAPFVTGVLIARLGSYSTVAVLFGLVYLVAVFALPFLPETKGKPLPA
ncbi:MAG: MFS transporter [Acidobacteria bacterium]|nr:MFS transporter [Acidobacteriota bacterium]